MKGFTDGAPGLRRALEAFRADDPSTGPRGEGAPPPGCGWQAGPQCGCSTTSCSTCWCTGSPALATLPVSLLFLSSVWVLDGELALATELIAQETADRGRAVALRRLVLAAWQGREAETVELYAAAVQEVTARGNRAEIALAHLARAVLQNGLGNYASALDAAERACAHLDATHTNAALPELVEAASR
ncbi:MAG: hypothetical protein H7Y15_13425, partial [Pseudonocardia sp.]|nr:hypothetical protein [Pseudonocardia sp.]